MHVCIHICRGLTSTLDVFLGSSPPNSLMQSLNLSHSLVSCLIWLASLLWGSPVLSPKARMAGKPPHPPGIYVGSQDSNSGPLLHGKHFLHWAVSSSQFYLFDNVCRGKCELECYVVLSLQYWTFLAMNLSATCMFYLVDYLLKTLTHLSSWFLILSREPRDVIPRLLTTGSCMTGIGGSVTESLWFIM